MQASPSHLSSPTNCLSFYNHFVTLYLWIGTRVVATASQGSIVFPDFCILLLILHSHLLGLSLLSFLLLQELDLLFPRAASRQRKLKIWQPMQLLGFWLCFFLMLFFLLLQLLPIPRVFLIQCQDLATAAVSEAS